MLIFTSMMLCRPTDRRKVGMAWCRHVGLIVVLIRNDRILSTLEITSVTYIYVATPEKCAQPGVAAKISRRELF